MGENGAEGKVMQSITNHTKDFKFGKRSQKDLTF